MLTALIIIGVLTTVLLAGFVRIQLSESKQFQRGAEHSMKVHNGISAKFGTGVEPISVTIPSKYRFYVKGRLIEHKHGFVTRRVVSVCVLLDEAIKTARWDWFKRFGLRYDMRVLIKNMSHALQGESNPDSLNQALATAFKALGREELLINDDTASWNKQEDEAKAQQPDFFPRASLV